MQYVADTNIWYNIADNIIDPKELIKDGNELYATPINIIEIAATTKISYATKKSIFKAIQEYKKGILPEPMCHLASLLGYDNIKEETDIWIKIVNQFLNSQIVPHDSLIFKKLNDHYHSFSKSIDGFNNSNVPGHSLANNKCNVTTDEDKERYKIMCQSKQFEDVIYISLHQTIKEYIFNDLKIQSKKS
ncbi:MAG: hypothetical protein KJ869_00560, partial [Candidatus Edwardsbacteria bacterium]|nr:hypothetical protein [Candidatus Edwardsbacteria bacterium]